MQRPRKGFFIFAQYSLFLFAIYLQFQLPPPGWAVGILAFCAVLMTYHEQVSTREKVIWIFVAFTLLIVELRAIEKDHSKNEARAVQDEQEFKTSMEVNRKGFLEMLSRAEIQNQTSLAALQAVTRGINIETGGNSFAFLEITMPTQAIEVIKIGDAPLYDVKIGIWSKSHRLNRPQTEIWQESRRTVLGNYPAGTQIGGIIGLLNSLFVFQIAPENLNFTLDANEAFFEVFFEARNGAWNEYEWLRNIPNPKTPSISNWTLAVRVYKSIMKKKKIIFEEISPGFPVDILPVRGKEQ